jgi:hypothetical protein
MGGEDFEVTDGGINVLQGNATFAGNITGSGRATFNGGSNDYHASARLAAYTPGGNGEPALYLDGGGYGDGLHISAGNNAYTSSQYAIKAYDQNSSNVVFGVIKANTSETDDCYNMNISGHITVGKETNHNPRFSTSSHSKYITIDAEGSGGGGIVWSQQSTSKVNAIISNHGQIEIGYSTADDASAAWVPGITLSNTNNATFAGNITGSNTATASFGYLRLAERAGVHVNSDKLRLSYGTNINGVEIGDADAGEPIYTFDHTYAHLSGSGESTGSFAILRTYSDESGISVHGTNRTKYSSLRQNILEFMNAGGVVRTESTTDLYLQTNSTNALSFAGSGQNATFYSNVYPDADAGNDLGSPGARWKNIYSADLQLTNVGVGGNEVDGTEGSWTIQEGEEDLYLLNRKNGKKYKFMLQEVE